MPESPDIFRASILNVDDQESNVRLLDFALRRGGYLAVSSTTEPLEVCALHRQNRYALIILDLQMPRMNGFEVMEGLAKIEGEEMVAVLVLSADPSQKVPALAAGARAFLSKPIVLAEVLLRVHELLEQALSRDIEAPALPPATDPAALLRVVR
ncbi:MAG TPA: response regulator [Thermoanaerobaculia bacterium]|nr:response regulator [Thermoanaerobaculia bacterium]